MGKSSKSSGLKGEETGKVNKGKRAKRPKKLIDARTLAFLAFTDTSIKIIPSARLELLAQRFKIISKDRALAQELVIGTTKRRATLDWLIRQYSSRSIRTIKAQLLELIRLGVYQLIFLQRVPDFAAVDQTVQLAKQRISPAAAGFANAVLRNVQRGMVKKPTPLEPTSVKATIPITGKIGVLMDKELFADPQQDPVKYLTCAYSYPKSLICRWLDLWPYDQVLQLVQAGNSRPVLVLRPNALKFSTQGTKKSFQPARQLLDLLAGQSVQARLAHDGRSVVIQSGMLLTNSRAFRKGLFQPQDTIAQLPVRQLGISSGQVILDMCTGLGTKATQMAELLGNRAQIYACDADPIKLLGLEKNCRRLGITSIRPISTRALRQLAAEGMLFDRIMLDVPCSNTGTLARREQARWRIKADSFELMAHRQGQLLQQAWQMLKKPHGRLVYSTCSIDPQENQQVLVESTPAEMQIVDQHTTMPRADDANGQLIHDGGYWALLVAK